MSAALEHRFDCDRCGFSINIPVQNKPVNQRGPEDWVTLLIDGEITRHFCGDCAAAFHAFMEDRPQRSLVNEHDLLVAEGR